MHSIVRRDGLKAMLAWRDRRYGERLAESDRGNQPNHHSARHLANHLDSDPDVGPSAIRRQELVSFKDDCGGDDQCVRKTEMIPVLCAQFGSSAADLACGGFDGGRKSIQEVVDRVAAGRALPQRCDEGFGIG